ncbi:MAG: hypothetical protein AAF533_28010, partial [Acidobacteriota bacterium]
MLADDDTRPITLPPSVRGRRRQRPALTRITGVGVGETHSVPTEAGHRHLKAFDRPTEIRFEQDYLNS